VTAALLLADGLRSAHGVAERLAWSHARLADFFPVTEPALEALTAEREESIDAYLHRFNNLLSIVQDHLFKSVALVEQEDIADKSKRDQTNLMEKLGAIPSATGFSSLAELRNRLAHHYPNEAAKQVERLNAAWRRGPDLIAAFNAVRRHVVAKRLADGPDVGEVACAVTAEP